MLERRVRHLSKEISGYGSQSHLLWNNKSLRMFSLVFTISPSLGTRLHPQSKAMNFPELECQLLTSQFVPQFEKDTIYFLTSVIPIQTNIISGEVLIWSQKHQLDPLKREVYQEDKNRDFCQLTFTSRGEYDEENEDLLFMFRNIIQRSLDR